MKRNRSNKWTALVLVFALLFGLLGLSSEWAGRAHAAVLFSDGFENGFGDWTAVNGTPTTSSFRVHNGRYGYELDEAKDAIRHTMASNTNKVVVVWLYDDASRTSDTNVFAFADRSSVPIGLGISDSVSATKYVYRIGMTETASTVDRTTGWHSLTFDYLSGTGVTLYIDGIEVASTTSETAFDRIQIGDIWDTAGATQLYFDDVSVQDHLPWSAYVAPTPSPAPTPRPAYLTAGFESGFGEWQTLYGTPASSTAQAHGGSNSYRTGADQDAIQYNYGFSLNKVAVVWFYDDAADTSLRTMAFADSYLSAMGIIGLGVNTAVSATKYVYRTGTDDTATSVTRTTGWHSLAFDYRSGTGVTLYIDGTQVAASTAATAFSRVALGDWWEDGNTGAVYFDDIASQDYLPGASPTVSPSPTPTPAPSPTPAPTPHPVNGVWFSDGFENGLGNWSALAGTASTSTAQQREGTHSYVQNEDLDWIQYSTAPFHKVGVVWFHDDAADTSLISMTFMDGGVTVGLGVDTEVSTTKYVYRHGGSIVATGVDRSTGWHSLVFDYRSREGATLYIDGVQVATLTNMTFFNHITIGDTWPGQSGTVYYDDIRILDYLPWEPPNAPGISFHDGFEEGFAAWTTVFGTASASAVQAHEGGSSYVLNDDQDVVVHNLGAATNGAAVGWFYDDAADSSLIAYAHADQYTSDTIGLGVDTTVSATNYVYRIGDTVTASAVARTTGWHSLAFDYRSGTGATLYVDGTEVASTTELTSFSYIRLGDYWSGYNGAVYFDDVSVQDFLPWEAYPFVSPPEPVIAAAMGFEAAGDWRTEAYLLEDNPGFIPDDLLSANGHPLDPEGALAHGATLSALHVRQGMYALKWDNHPYYPTLSTRNVRRDWSTSNLLSFWAYSEERTDEEISLVVYSDDVANANKDFYYHTFKVDWTGWKKIEIPLAAFVSHGDTAGWQSVQAVHFVTKMFNRQPSPHTVLYMDEMELSSQSQMYIAGLLPASPAPTPAPVSYITKYPAGFEAMTLDDYLLYVNNKLEYPHAAGGRQTEIAAENNAILAGYSLGLDSQYALNQFVDTQSPIAAPHDIVPFDPTVLNHGYGEISVSQSDPIRFEAYWKSERAVYGYYPQFNSAPVSIAPDGHKYLKYGDSIIQSYNAVKEKWYYLDIEPAYRDYATGKGWYNYSHRDANFYNDVKIRFDSSGDAYMLSVVQQLDAGGATLSTQGLLLYSNDKMKTWTVHELDHPFAKFESIDTFNTDALSRPPVITLHDSWYTSDKSGYINIPVKSGGGLTVSPSVKFCESCITTGAYHSGDANIAITSGTKVHLVYGVSELERSPSIPAGHPSNLGACSVGPIPCRNGTPAFAVTYDIVGKTVSSPVFIGYGGAYVDDHNWPALTMDSDGYLHAFINGHHDPFTYVKAANADSTASWTEPTYVGSGHTYASVAIDSEDKLYVVTRDSYPGYAFNLSLATKTAAGDWEDHRFLVQRAKLYYDVWNNKMTIDPTNGYLYVTYYAQSQQIQMFKDEYDAMLYIWPEREASINPLGAWTPSGTYRTHDGQYGIFGFTPSEPVTIVSTDGGDTWRLTTTEDY